MNKIPKLNMGTEINDKNAFQFLFLMMKNKITNPYNKKSYLFVMQIPARNELITRFRDFLSSLKFKRKYNEYKKLISPYKTDQE